MVLIECYNFSAETIKRLSREKVSEVIENCNHSNLINSHSVNRKHGQLDFKKSWNRVAISLTHVDVDNLYGVYCVMKATEVVGKF